MGQKRRTRDLLMMGIDSFNSIQPFLIKIGKIKIQYHQNHIRTTSMFQTKKLHHEIAMNIINCIDMFMIVNKKKIEICRTKALNARYRTRYSKFLHPKCYHSLWVAKLQSHAQHCTPAAAENSQAFRHACH